MSERDPSPKVTYSGPRDEALYGMAQADWANESTGSDDSVTGPVWRISNSEAELSELTEVFGEQWTELGVQPEQMLGHFILGERSAEGVGLVIEYDDEDALISAFEVLKARFEQSRDKPKGSGFFGGTEDNE